MKIKQLLLLGIPSVVIIGFSLILQLTVLSQPDKIAGWLSSFGPSLILVYIILQTITIVIPPLGGLFLQIALLAVLGPFWGIVLTYLVVTPLYLVNFYPPSQKTLDGKSGDECELSASAGFRSDEAGEKIPRALARGASYCKKIWKALYKEGCWKNCYGKN